MNPPVYDTSVPGFNSKQITVTSESVSNSAVGWVANQLCHEMVQAISEHEVPRFVRMSTVGAVKRDVLYLHSAYPTWADHPAIVRMAQSITQPGADWLASLGQSKGMQFAKVADGEWLFGNMFYRAEQVANPPRVTTSFVNTYIRDTFPKERWMQAATASISAGGWKTPPALSATGGNLVAWAPAEWYAERANCASTVAAQQDNAMAFAVNIREEAKLLATAMGFTITGKCWFGTSSVDLYDPTKTLSQQEIWRRCRFTSMTRFGTSMVYMRVMEFYVAVEVREKLEREVYVLATANSSAAQTAMGNPNYLADGYVMAAVSYPSLRSGKRLMGDATSGYNPFNTQANRQAFVDFYYSSITDGTVVEEAATTDPFGFGTQYSRVGEADLNLSATGDIYISNDLLRRMLGRSKYFYLPLVGPLGSTEDAMHVTKVVSCETTALQVDEGSTIAEGDIVQSDWTGVLCSYSTAAIEVESEITALTFEWYQSYVTTGFGFYSPKKSDDLAKALEKAGPSSGKKMTRAIYRANYQIPRDIVKRLDAYKVYEKACNAACKSNDFMKKKFADGVTYGDANTQCNDAGPKRAFFGYADAEYNSFDTTSVLSTKVYTYAPGTSPATLSSGGVTYQKTDAAQVMADLSMGATLSGITKSTLITSWGISVADSAAYDAVAVNVNKAINSVKRYGTYGGDGNGLAPYSFSWRNLGVDGYPLIGVMSSSDQDKMILRSVVIMQPMLSNLFTSYDRCGETALAALLVKGAKYKAKLLA